MTVINKNTLAVVKDVINGKTYVSIARKHNVGISAIGFVAHELGIKRRSFSATTKKWTDKTIDTYLLSHSSTIRRVSDGVRHCRTYATWKCSLCGHEWDQTFGTIQSGVENSGGKGCKNCGKNEYNVYHDFLSTMNEYSAYFIGVYMAKGVKQGNRISISSDSKEKLEKIADLISCTHPITKTSNRYYLRFKSTKIASKLPDKKRAVDATAPKNISKYFKDFLRGYTDFKGFYSNEKYSAHRVLLTGDVKFLRSVKRRYANRLSGLKKFALRPPETIKCGHIDEDKKEYLISAGIYPAYHFMEWVYNSDINPLRYVSGSRYNAYLDLKEKVSQIESREKYVKTKLGDYEDLQKEFRQTLTFNKIASKYNITYDQVKKISTNVSADVSEDTKILVRSEINRRRLVKKMMKELKTRTRHKSGSSLYSLKSRSKREK